MWCVVVNSVVRTITQLKPKVKSVENAWGSCGGDLGYCAAAITAIVARRRQSDANLILKYNGDSLRVYPKHNSHTKEKINTIPDKEVEYPPAVKRASNIPS